MSIYTNIFLHYDYSVHQAQRAAIIGLEKLTSLGVKITRPQDYFAEMLKTDEQMRKVLITRDSWMLTIYYVHIY